MFTSLFEKDTQESHMGGDRTTRGSGGGNGGAGVQGAGTLQGERTWGGEEGASERKLPARSKQKQALGSVIKSHSTRSQLPSRLRGTARPSGNPTCS